jgi:hypothetical protein
MLRPLPLLAILLAGLVALRISTSADSAAPGSEPRPATPHKPLAPIEITLTTPDGEPLSAERGSVPLRFAIEPVIEMAELSWRWELPPELALAEGPLAGVAASEVGAVSAGQLTLVVPDDGRYHRAELAVSGAFETLDEAGQPTLETVTRVEVLTWGEPSADLPVVTTVDPATGEQQPRAVVPGLHRPAAQPQGEGR